MALASSCQPSGFEVFTSLSARVPTVVLVDWTPLQEDVDEAWVELGSTRSYDRVFSMDLSSGTPYEAVLVGLKPDSQYHYRVVARSDGSTMESDDMLVTTGSVDVALPTLVTETYDPDLLSDGFLVTSIFSGPPAAVILDSDMDYVWWYIPDGEFFPVVRARLSQDGQHVYLWTDNASNGPYQQLKRINMAGTRKVALSLPGGHHDFVELPDGTVGYIQYESMDTQQGELVGDVVVEVINGDDKEEIYSVWDDVSPDYESAALTGEGWSHGNYISYGEGEDKYYVSFMGFEAIFKIDRPTGSLDWIMGGALSDFTDAQGGTAFWERQHGFQVLDDAILIMDNGSFDRGWSQVLRYGFDESTAEVDLEWSYRPEPSLYSYCLGSAIQLPNGNVLATFAVSGQMDEISPDGQLVRRINLPITNAFGYTSWVEQLGRQD